MGRRRHPCSPRPERAYVNASGEDDVGAGLVPAPKGDHEGRPYEDYEDIYRFFIRGPFKKGEWCVGPVS